MIRARPHRGGSTTVVRRSSPLPDPDTLCVERVLLASEGRRIPAGAVKLAASFAKRSGAPVRVFSVARIWGTSLGLPMPGLLPSRREWEEQRTIVRDAVHALRRQGVEAEGHVQATRRPAKQIVAEARRLGCSAIVMGADARRNALVADFLWSQEPYRVRRGADVPVYLVLDAPPFADARRRASQSPVPLHAGQARSTELSASSMWPQKPRESRPSACWRPQRAQRRNNRDIP